MFVLSRRPGESIREYLVRRCTTLPQRSAVRALSSMVTDEELERGWEWPEFWKAAVDRWLRDDPARRSDTGRSYLSKVRVGLGISAGYGPRPESMW